MARYLQIIFLFFFFLPGKAQTPPDHVEPPFWWTGLKNPGLQILVHGKDIASSRVVLSSVKEITLDSISLTDNPNYLFINLTIKPDIQPCSFDIKFFNEDKLFFTYPYELKKRGKGSALRQGFNSSDVIYLLMPDRFANGNTGNDAVKGMKEGADRKDPYGRHGGDIKGILDHLDYIRDMGFTALWTTPVLENNQPEQSYHGYAITDFYKVDPRLGSNPLYSTLGKQCQKNGIKLIMDMVFNHCGSGHWWMKDLPSSDWIHNYPDFFITNHIHSAQMDPHASVYDKRRLTNGWFVPSMPDLNQNNPFLATYLIQNSIWWIEYAHLAGIRMDTYPYPDKYFMARWNQRIREEYPRFTIVGEEWNFQPAIVSYWQCGQFNRDGYKPGLPSLMDFPLQHALIQSLTEKDAWNTGWIRLYNILALDFLYPDPQQLVVFPDNHDMSRFFMQVDTSLSLFRLGLAFILTTRGIPQIFYGTEILLTHPEGDGHGYIRKDFPGGWQGDSINAFTGKNLSPEAETTQNELRTLVNWRKNNPVIHYGQLIHFVPENGVYVYFRIYKNKTVMVVLNKNNKVVKLKTDRFAEMTGNFSAGRNIYDQKDYALKPVLLVPPKTPLILELH